MTFSFSNPDVDRVSLSERVRKLEARFPGGGGGGGLGVGMPDFDQYPDNAYSDTPYGIICKISIDDFANQNVPELSGVGLKGCILMRPVINWGVISSIGLARVHLRKQYASVITTTRVGIQSNITLANQNIITDFQNHNYPASGFNSSQVIHVTMNTFRNPTGDGYASNQLATNMFCSVRIDCVTKGKVTITLNKSTQSTTGVASYPCYMFGCGVGAQSYYFTYSPFINITAGSSLGKVQNNGYISAVQLSDLPSYVSTLYPKSWCQ